MILNVSGATELWETIPVLELAQQYKHQLSEVKLEALHRLCQLAKVDYYWGVGYEGDRPVDFNRAYRLADKSPTYHGAVTEAHHEWGTLVLHKEYFEPVSPGCIVVCPQPLRQGLGIPNDIWKHVIKFLRTYERKVYLLSSTPHECMRWGFYENELLIGEEHIVDMCSILSGAELIIGVPNAQMWLASAFQNKSIVLHPEDDQIRRGGLSRWYPYTKVPGRAVVHHDTESMRVPVVLAAIRKLLPILEHELASAKLS